MPSLTKDPSTWHPAQAPAPITLKGQYVTLEPLSAANHANSLWQAVKGQDEVWTDLGDAPYAREEEFTQALLTKETGAAARFFAILPAEQPEAKGYASLMRFDPPNGVIEVGNILFSPALQRTPAATETIYLLARHIFEDLGYRRFEWKCNALNLPSRRAAERYGFTYEGTFRQHMIVKGQNRDTYDARVNTSAASYFTPARAVNNVSDIRQGDLLVYMEGNHAKTNPGHVMVVESLSVLCSPQYPYGNLRVVESTGADAANPKLSDSIYKIDKITSKGGQVPCMILTTTRLGKPNFQVSVMRH